LLKILLIDDEKIFLICFMNFSIIVDLLLMLIQIHVGIEDFRENYDNYALIINDIQVNCVK
jgi:hypothetical protein